MDSLREQLIDRYLKIRHYRIHNMTCFIYW